MDLYKLVTLMILLNMGVAIGMAATEGQTWVQTIQNNTAIAGAAQAVGLGTTYQNSTNLAGQQGSGTTQQYGGINVVLLVLFGWLGLLCIFGGATIIETMVYPFMWPLMAITIMTIIGSQIFSTTRD